jgi:hypothetical protein
VKDRLANIGIEPTSVPLRGPLAAHASVGCREIKEEHHGYSDTNNILYVVYNHKWSPVDPLDHNVYIGPGKIGDVVD